MERTEQLRERIIGLFEAACGEILRHMTMDLYCDVMEETKRAEMSKKVQEAL